ncbi:MAG: hypothetical protein HY361_01110 [Candidatus Aenigmarchaeota archaeon]|nr:hypothetical protein [Candidatus Aenigmarchaeota archaeon]
MVSPILAVITVVFVGIALFVSQQSLEIIVETPASVETVKTEVPKEEPKAVEAPKEPKTTTPTIETKPAPPPPLPSPEYPDGFEGTLTNITKYSTKITGSGTITQNNEIIQTGNANNEVIWNILYTTQKIDFTKDFTIEVDVDLTGSVSHGDAMAIIGVEDVELVMAGKKPNAGYCELSTGGHGNIIRMESSGMQQTTVSTTKGKIKLAFEAANSKLSCSFDGQTVSETQVPKSGQFTAALRSGLHEIIPAYGHETENPTSGSLTVKYDNLNIAK